MQIGYKKGIDKVNIHARSKTPSYLIKSVILLLSVQY